MVVFQSNLADKLFGYAISKDYVKYNTPYCDLLDDPILGTDIDLAINFNQALNGNLSSRETFTNTLVLCSGILDPGTVDYWTKKMYNYPVFRTEIERIVYTFNNINYGRDSFTDKLKRALEDCLNSPCNIFAPMSDSIGVLTNPGPIMTEGTIYPVGSLKDAFTIITGGIDQSVFNRIPELFQGGIVKLNQLCSTTWSAMLDYTLGRDTIENSLAKAQEGTLRAGANGYVYTPDIDSYATITKISTDLTSDIANDLGGCFRRYQHHMEYNPYSSNQNTQLASDIKQLNVNGVSYDALPTSQPVNTPIPNSNNMVLGTGSLEIGDTVVAKQWDGSTALTQPITLEASSNSQFSYSIFGGWLDETNRNVWVDDLNTAMTGDKGDDLTIAGFCNIGPYLTPCRGGTNDASMLELALEKKQVPAVNCVGYATLHAKGETTNTDLTVRKGHFNHGIALNPDFISRQLGQQIQYSQIKKLQRENKIFGIITYKNKTHLVQMIDYIGGKNGIRVDFTPYAFKTVTGTDPGPPGGGSPAVTTMYGSWKVIKYKVHPNVGPMTFRIGIGTKDEILQLLNARTGPITQAGLGLPPSQVIQSPSLNAVGNAEGNVKYVSNIASKTRNLPLQPMLFNALVQAATQTKINVVISSAGQPTTGRRRTGTNRHNNGWAADVLLYTNGKQLSCRNQADIPYLEAFASACRAAGCTGFGMGPSYMGSVAMHVDMASGNSIPAQGVTTWGDHLAGGGARTPAWLRRAVMA